MADTRERPAFQSGHEITSMIRGGGGGTFSGGRSAGVPFACADAHPVNITADPMTTKTDSATKVAKARRSQRLTRKQSFVIFVSFVTFVNIVIPVRRTHAC